MNIFEITDKTYQRFNGNYKKDAATDLFIESFAQKTKEGIIKKPLPAPIIPVRKPKINLCKTKNWNTITFLFVALLRPLLFALLRLQLLIT